MTWLVDPSFWLVFIPTLAAVVGILAYLQQWTRKRRARVALETKVFDYQSEETFIKKVGLGDRHLPIIRLYLLAGYELNQILDNGLSPLIHAIRKEQPRTVEMFLDRRWFRRWGPRFADPHYRSRSETSPIMAAVLVDHADIETTLRHAGGREEEDRGARVILAAAAGDPHEVSRLLAYPKLDRRARGFDRETALMTAAAGGHLEVVKRLLAAEDPAGAAELLRCRDLNDLCAEDYARARGHRRVASFLHDQAVGGGPGPTAGAPAATPVDETTEAVARRDLTAFDRFSETAIDPRATDPWGRPLLTVAVATRSLRVVDRVLGALTSSGEALGSLLDDGGTAEAPPLVEAVRLGLPQIVQRLLDAGADPNVADGAGATPLLVACRLGHLAIVEALLATTRKPGGKPVWVDLPGPEDATPLLAAVEHGRIDVVERLLAANSDPDRADAVGRTPLFLALADGSPRAGKLAELLRRRQARAGEAEARLLRAAASGRTAELRELVGASTTAGIPDSAGRPALLRAAQRGKVDSVRALLDPEPAEGIDVEWRDNDGSTALLLAVAGGHLEVVRELLRRRVRTDVRRADGTTALMAAAWRGDRDTVQVLLGEQPKLIDEAGPAGRTALMLASARGHAGVVDELLTAGASADAVSHSGETALLLSRVNGRVEVVERLHQDGVTAGDLEADLLVAAATGDAARTRELLDGGVDVNVVSRGRSPLIEAAGRGHREVVELLVGAEVDVEVRGRRDATALERAARNGRRRIVEILLDAGGADVDAPGERGNPPLISAIVRERRQTVYALLRRGADVDVRDPGGATPLLLAILAGDAPLEKTLRKAGAGRGEREARLILAAEAGDGTAVGELLDAGADPRVCAPRGRSALLGASEGGHQDVVGLLLRGGAPPDGCPGHHTPLGVAAVRGEVEILRELVAFGADLEATAERRRTALHLAAEAGRLEAVGFLRDSGSDVNARDGVGDTPLILACREGRADVVNFLLEQEADWSIHGRDGGTALMTATEHGHDAVVEALLAKQGKKGVDASDAAGSTPLIRASARDRRWIAAALLAAGADVDARDHFDDTPLMEAILEEHDEIRRLLVAKQAKAGALEAKLLLAARRGNAAEVAKLLNDGEVKIDARRRGGDTALILAAAGGWTEIVDALLSAGADAAVRGRNGRTALLAAVETGKVTLVDRLADTEGAGTTVEAVSRGETAATLADTEGHYHLVSLLVEKCEALPPDGIVSMTPNGRRYHRESCRHVRLGGRTLTLRRALRDGHKPCGRCITNQ